MRDKIVSAFSEEEEGRVAALRTLGLPRKEARIVVYLAMDHRAINYRAIEVEAGLRQPEVSVGLKALRNKGIVEGVKLTSTLDEIGLALYETANNRLVKAAEKLGAI
jgi:predicted transcriptional regulator